MTSVKEIVSQMSIGSSDVAAILGISPFGDQWTIFARKKGLIQPEETDEQYIGKKLEPLVAEIFSEKMDLPIRRASGRYYHDKRPWQHASPDYFVLTEEEELLECKTAGFAKSREWARDIGDGDGMPDYYLVQVEWQLSALKRRTAYVAVLIAGQDFRIYKVQHDPMLEEILLEECEKFWREHLMADVAPPIGGSRQARDYLRKRYPRDREGLRPAKLAEIDLLTEYSQVRAKLEPLVERKEQLENQLKQAVGDHEGLAWPGGKFTWKKARDSSETDWEALARSQIDSYPVDEQKTMIAEYTHPVPGARRINFREESL